MTDDRAPLTLEERVREKEALYATLLDRPRRGLALAALAVAVLFHVAAFVPGVLTVRAAGAASPGNEPRRLLLTSLPAPPAEVATEAPAREPVGRATPSLAVPASDPVQPPFPAIDTGGEPPEAEILPGEPEPSAPTIAAPVVVDDATQPILIAESRVEPEYPAIARRSGYGATLLLRALVLASGHVGEVTVLRSSHPNLGFEAAAARAVRQWRYAPALRAGRPVDAYVYVNVHFRPK